MKNILMVILVLLAMPVYGFSPTLENKDNKKYDMKIECMTTTNRSIGSNTSTTLNGNAGCTLHVARVGSIKLENDKDYVIKDGNLSVK